MAISIHAALNVTFHFWTWVSTYACFGGEYLVRCRRSANLICFCLYRGGLARCNRECFPKSMGGSRAGLKLFSTFINCAPQAFKISIAPTVGFMVQIIKGTSLAYIIGFSDLMYIGKRWEMHLLMELNLILFSIMALIYFFLCFPLKTF